MKQITFLLFSVITFLCACSSDYELKKSIFIPDKNNPGLPVYSEQGFNTFGVYYDRVPFINNEETPIKVIVEDGTTSFQFNGVVGFSLGEDMKLTLVKNNFDPQAYTDLLTLHSTTIDLKQDAEWTIVIENTEGIHPAEILSGTFMFKRAQNLTVDKELFEVILSGTFEFQAIINGIPVTVSDGRFDVGVGSFNFYHY